MRIPFFSKNKARTPMFGRIRSDFYCVKKQDLRIPLFGRSG